MDQINRVRESVGDLILWVALGLLVLVWGVMYRWRKRQRRLPNVRDVTMTVEGRRLHVQRAVLNAVADGILDAHLNGEIEADEANAELARIARFYHHEELIPLIKDKKTKLMKRKLRDLKRRRDLNGKGDRLPIPEPPKTVAKPKSAGDLLASILGS